MPAEPYCTMRREHGIAASPQSAKLPQGLPLPRVVGLCRLEHEAFHRIHEHCSETHTLQSSAVPFRTNTSSDA